MVLESEISAPSQIDSRQSSPSSGPISTPTPMVSSIWMGVPISAMPRTGRRSLSENSRPSANSSRATPISASSSMSCVFASVTPAVLGPRMTPARMYPRTRG